jgi:hypothetical protein
MWLPTIVDGTAGRVRPPNAQFSGPIRPSRGPGGFHDSSTRAGNRSWLEGRPCSAIAAIRRGTGSGEASGATGPTMHPHSPLAPPDEPSGHAERLAQDTTRANRNAASADFPHGLPRRRRPPARRPWRDGDGRPVGRHPAIRALRARWTRGKMGEPKRWITRDSMRSPRLWHPGLHAER